MPPFSIRSSTDVIPYSNNQKIRRDKITLLRVIPILTHDSDIIPNILSERKMAYIYIWIYRDICIHIYLSMYISIIWFILTFFLASIRRFFLASILTLLLASILIFFVAFYRAYILTFYLAVFRASFLTSMFGHKSPAAPGARDWFDSRSAQLHP